MEQIRKILVPIDLSNHSARVLELAGELCRKHEASATLLHVWDPLSVATPHNEQLLGTRVVRLDLSQLTLELETAADTLRAQGAVAVDVNLEHGRADREIIACAKAGGFDLIIMGTHGRTGLSHVLLGSVAERVVRRAPCPVMTVRLNDSRQPAVHQPFSTEAG